MIDTDRFMKVSEWLRKRYTRPSDGDIVTSVNGEPTRYAIIYDWAYMRYLGCNPDKLTFPGCFHADGTQKRLTDYLPWVECRYCGNGLEPDHIDRETRTCLHCGADAGEAIEQFQQRNQWED